MKQRAWQGVLGVLLGLWMLVAGVAAASSEPLDPRQAFRLSVRALGPGQAEALFQVTPGYYLYHDRFQFLSATPGVTVQAALPPGQWKDDPTFGRTQVHPSDVRVPLEVRGSGAVSVRISYQGCWEQGLCYPPQTDTVVVTLPPLGAVEPPPANDRSVAPSPAASLPSAAPADLTASGVLPYVAPVPTSGVPTAPITSDRPATATADDDPGQLDRVLQAREPWRIGLTFLGLGVLMAFTACMYPLLPIVSGIITGQGATLSKTRGLMLTLVYVQGLALTYMVIGVAAGLTGVFAASLLQHPLVLAAFALVFVALALAMFGFYDLQLPSAWQTRVHEFSNRFPGGQWLGVFAMGAASAVLVGPCNAPPLAAAAAYVLATGDTMTGALALYALGLGLGLPLVVIGVFGGHVLPRAGRWMVAVKRVLGVVMLGVALYFLDRIEAVPTVLVMVLSAILLVVAAMYLNALDPLPTRAPGWQRLAKGLGVLLLVAGVAVLLGALSGNRDLLQPLKGWRQAAAAGELARLPFQRVRNTAELDQALLAARGRPVMLDFYAYWCSPCHRLERETFSDPQVRAALAGYVLLQADVGAQTADDLALSRRFGVIAPPVMVFFDAQGHELREAKLIAFHDAPSLVRHIQRITP